MEEGSLDPAPVWTDLKSFDGTDWRGAVDLIAAGYPCQPFSHAGKRKGADDPRHLWPDVARVIRETQPRALVLENVQGHITKGLQEVLEEITELGFDAEWGVYSAAQAGLPHRRNRLFILAYSRSGGLEVLRGSGLLDGVRAAQRDDANGCYESVGYPDSSPDERCGERGELPGASRSLEGGEGIPQQCPSDSAGQSVADTDSKGSQGRDGSQPEGPDQWTARPLGPEDDWSDVPEYLWPATQSNICGVPDGLSNRVDRLRALGNAVVPQQAELAIKDLLRRIDDRKDPE
jgi:DNA (cytosine-5)-methyltransferase 1